MATDLPSPVIDKRLDFSWTDINCRPDTYHGYTNQVAILFGTVESTASASDSLRPPKLKPGRGVTVPVGLTLLFRY